MKKVMLILMLGFFSMSLSSFKSNSIVPEAYDPSVDAYVDAWLTVYLNTLDMDAADAAAWDAEDSCQDVVTAGDWLERQ